MRYIRLRHELVAARWDEETAKWHIKIRRGPDGDEFEDTADVLFLGTGALSRYRWPDIPGLDTFGGTLVHSAKWDLPGSTWQDDVVGWKEKDVGVIGNVRLWDYLLDASSSSLCDRGLREFRS